MLGHGAVDRRSFGEPEGKRRPCRATKVSATTLEQTRKDTGGWCRGRTGALVPGDRWHVGRDVRVSGNLDLLRRRVQIKEAAGHRPWQVLTTGVLVSETAHRTEQDGLTGLCTPRPRKKGISESVALS